MGRGGTPTDVDVVVIGGEVAGSGMAWDVVGVEGMVSIVGGERTTFRLMAEKTANAFCAKLGVERPCATARTKLPPAKAACGG